MFDRAGILIKLEADVVFLHKGSHVETRHEAAGWEHKSIFAARGGR